MGKCKVSFKELADGTEFNKWVKLSPQKEKDEVTGEIRVSLQFRKSPNITLGLTDSANRNKSFMIEQEEQEHPLFTAIKNSDLRKVEELLSDPNLNINMKDKFGYTPLHSACCIFSDVDDQILEIILKHKGTLITRRDTQIIIYNIFIQYTKQVSDGRSHQIGTAMI